MITQKCFWERFLFSLLPFWIVTGDMKQTGEEGESQGAMCDLVYQLSHMTGCCHKSNQSLSSQTQIARFKTGL